MIGLYLIEKREGKLVYAPETIIAQTSFLPVKTTTLETTVGGENPILKGGYLIMPSTYDRNVQGTFILSVKCDRAFDLVPTKWLSISGLTTYLFNLINNTGWASLKAAKVTLAWNWSSIKDYSETPSALATPLKITSSSNPTSNCMVTSFTKKAWRRSSSCKPFIPTEDQELPTILSKYTNQHRSFWKRKETGLKLNRLSLTPTFSVHSFW